MDNQIHNAIVSFIWGIADDCLRDVYVRGKYRDVILLMTVIRRLDVLLEDSKEAVLDMKKKLDAAKIYAGYQQFYQNFKRHTKRSGIGFLHCCILPTGQSTMSGVWTTLKYDECEIVNMLQ